MKPALSVRIRAKDRSGRCYELAGKGLLNDDADEWTLVHGVLQTPNLGLMPHAWLERGDVAYDPVLDSIYTQDYYYTRWQAVVHARYSRVEMAKAVADSGKWGPWLEARPAA
jgi:hypothetical protein